MAELHVVYWRDIPAQVVARKGRDRASVELAGRFAEAIDKAAMRADLRDSDAYLGEWRRGAALACGDDLETAARAEAARIEGVFSKERLDDLVRRFGQDGG